VGFGGGDLTTQTWDEMGRKTVGGVDDIPRIDSAMGGPQGIRVVFRCLGILGGDTLYGCVCFYGKDVVILGQKPVPDGCYEAVGPEGAGPVRDGSIYAWTGAELLSAQVS